MKRSAFLVIVLGIVAFLVMRGSSLLPVAHAGGAIDNGSVSGSYTFEFQGVNPISVNNLQGVRAGVGVMNFDGAGNVSGSFTQIDIQACCINGATTTSTITTGTFTGTYNVNPDATAILDLTGTETLNPGNVSKTNEIKLMTAFSGGFKRFKFVQVFSADATNSGSPLPGHVTSGRGEKVSH